MRIEIHGMAELLAQLERTDPKDGKRVMDKATADAAKKVLKAPVKAEAGKVSKRLASSVRAGAAKREKPAGIVRFDPKRAFFRHFVIGGTKDHSIKAKGKKALAYTQAGVTRYARDVDVRGVKANPIISRVADAYEDRTLDHVERYLSREFGLDD